MACALEIRRLTPADAAAAANLLLLDRSAFLVQDRCNDFFALHRFLSGESGVYWGAFKGSGLVGVSGFYPYRSASPPFAEAIVSYNTDSMVAPGARGGRIYPALLKAQTDYFHALEGRPLSWGIENVEGGLSGCAKLLERFGMATSLRHRTELTEIYVDKRMEFPRGHSVQVTLLRDIGENFWLEFAERENRKGTSFLLYPKLDPEFLGAIAASDPEAARIEVRCGGESASCLSWSLGHVRKFRMPEGTNIIATKLGRFHRQKGASLEPGDELRVLSLSYVNSTGTAALQALIQSAYARASTSSYDVIIARDLPANALAPAIRSAYTHSRRILLVVRRKDERFLRDMETKSTKLETGFF